MINIQTYENPKQLGEAAAERFATEAERAIAARGQFNVALSGGSTPKTTYALLAEKPFSDVIAWQSVHVFWGDERCVPPSHTDSNYLIARETFLEKVPLPSENIHRMRGELAPKKAASAYQAELESALGEQGRFDLILLGMGTDGHTASLFPGTQALKENKKWVVANYVHKVDLWRITLTFPSINAARHVVFLVRGARKAAPLARVQAGQNLPATMVNPAPGTLTWLVDSAAAGQLA